MDAHNQMSPWRKNQRIEARQTFGDLLLAMMPMWAMFPSLGIMIAVFSPGCVAWLLGEAAETGDAAALLTAARRWYLLILAGFALAALLSFLLVIWAVRRLGCRGTLAQLAGLLGVLVLLCLGGEMLLFGAIIDMEELPQHVAWAGEDLESIAEDRLETVECFISPKAHPACLPGPYTENLPEPLTRYGVIGEDTGRKWVTLLVPNGLAFALDPERLYDEDQSVGWNQENALRYVVRYTSNLHIVTEIEAFAPLPGGDCAIP